MFAEPAKEGVRGGLQRRNGTQLPQGRRSGNCIPDCSLRTGRSFRNAALAESVSQNRCSKRSAASQWALLRKVHPGMSPQSGTRFPKPAPSGNWGPRTKSRTQFGSRRESDVYERGARGDSLGVPPERPVRPRRLQEPAAFPEQGQPVCLAQAGGGGRADRPRDARPGGVHALLARRGQPRVRLPTEASSRRGRGQNEEDRARRGRRRGVSVNLFFTSFAKQACRSRKGGFTGCANVFSPIPVTA